MLAGLDSRRRAPLAIGDGGAPRKLPILSRLFARNSKETQQTDIILMLTPRIIQVLELTEAGIRPFRVGRADNATVIDLPLPQPTPIQGGPPRDPAPRDDQQKPNQPAPVGVEPSRASPAPPHAPINGATDPSSINDNSAADASAGFLAPPSALL